MAKYILAILVCCITGCSEAKNDSYSMGRLPQGAGWVICENGYKFHFITGFSSQYVQVREVVDGVEVLARCPRKHNDAMP